jgi:hypothetical protein
MITISPRARLKPAESAIALPKFLRSRTARMRACFAESSVITFQESSVEPSSTKMSSHSCAPASSATLIRSASSGKLSASFRPGMTIEMRGSAAGLVIASGAGSASTSASVPFCSTVSPSTTTVPSMRAAA